MMVQFIQPASSDQGHLCTGAALLDRLRIEVQTGYPDVEEVALDLLRVAEEAWLRQLSTWILFGRLPASGAEDFFVQEDVSGAKSDSRSSTLTIKSHLLPKIVSPTTASSTLFLGRSLNQIRLRNGSLDPSGISLMDSTELRLLPAHLRFFSALPSPLTSSALASAILSIRQSLSKNALQRLLPLPKILEVLTLLREFMLLSRGEFAIALITEASQHGRSRWRTTGHIPKKQASSRLGSVAVKSGEVTAVLGRTWATLSSYQGDDEEPDEMVELARERIQLTLVTPANGKDIAQDENSEVHKTPQVAFNDLLLSTPTNLTLRITSPLDLFLTASDLKLYSSLSAYLLSIRRGHLRLTDLWKCTALRRVHPAPVGPPMSNARSAMDTLQKHRARAQARTHLMRKVWASSSAAVYLLGELGEYFQGEVVQGSWQTFHAWLEGPSTQPEPALANTNSVPLDASDRDDADIWPSSPPSGEHYTTTEPHTIAASEKAAPHDPESVAQAHCAFLNSLASCLLIMDTPFTTSLRSFLLLVDRLVECVATLQGAWLTLDLEEDDGVVDAFTDSRREEKMAIVAVCDVSSKVDAELGRLVARLKALDDEMRDSGVVNSRVINLHGGTETEKFRPWTSRGLEALLMKLDFGSLIT